MHVLILNQTFHPDVAATGQLMWDLARHLSDRGHRVTVLTSRQFYGTDRLHDSAFERIGNVEIHRLRGTAFGKRTSLGRMTDFATFYAAAAMALFRLPAPDVILALTSPPMVSTLAALRKRFGRRNADGRRVKFVYHVMDLYPDVVAAHGTMRPGHPLLRLCASLTARTLAAADAVIALGEDMKRRLITNWPRHACPDRIHVIQPWAEGDALSAIDSKAANPLARQFGLDRTFNVVYSGNLGLAHDVDTITAAIDRTRDEADVRWVFIGSGKRLDPLPTLATRRRWPNVIFLPFQPRERLNRSLNLADVHLVTQLPAFTGVVVPSKLFGILAVGKPAVFVGPADAECARVIAEHGAGRVVANGDVDGLVAAIRELRADDDLRRRTGERARRAFEANYDKPVACRRIESILQMVVDEA